MSKKLLGAAATAAMLAAAPASPNAPLFIMKDEGGQGQSDAEKQAKAMKDAFVKMLEGYATTADMEKFQTEITEKMISRDDVLAACKSAVEEHFAATPDPTKEAEWEDKGQAGFKKSIALPTMKQYMGQVRHGHLVAKSNVAGNITGAPEGAIDVTAAMAAGNPFREDVMVMQMAEGVVKIPILPPQMFHISEPGAVVGGNPRRAAAELEASSTDLVAVLAEALAEIGEPAMEDLPGIRGVIEYEYTQRYSTAQAARIFAKIKAGNFVKVKTGVAAGLPTKANIIAKVSEVIESVATPYRMGAVWHISRSVESLLNQANAGTNGDFAFNPSIGVRTLMGYPVRVNDNLEDGKAAARVSAVFGNFRQGIILGERRSLDLTDNPYTKPGYRTFYGSGRFEAGEWHKEALAQLVTAA